MIFWTLTSIVSLPSCTAFSNNGKIVSKPGKPGGAFSLVFSCTVWGAKTKIQSLFFCKSKIQIRHKIFAFFCLPWSVAKQSIASKLSHNACWSSFDTREGRTWPFFSPIRLRSSLQRKRWCGHTSQVTARPWTNI